MIGNVNSPPDLLLVIVIKKFNLVLFVVVVVVLPQLPGQQSGPLPSSDFYFLPRWFLLESIVGFHCHTLLKGYRLIIFPSLEVIHWPIGIKSDCHQTFLHPKCVRSKTSVLNQFIGRPSLRAFNGNSRPLRNKKLWYHLVDYSLGHHEFVRICKRITTTYGPIWIGLQRSPTENLKTFVIFFDRNDRRKKLQFLCKKWCQEKKFVHKSQMHQKTALKHVFLCELFPLSIWKTIWIQNWGLRRSFQARNTKIFDYSGSGFDTYRYFPKWNSPAAVFQQGKYWDQFFFICFRNSCVPRGL